jgi:hypothetical protein
LFKPSGVAPPGIAVLRLTSLPVTSIHCGYRQRKTTHKQYKFEQFRIEKEIPEENFVLALYAGAVMEPSFGVESGISRIPARHRCA